MAHVLFVTVAEWYFLSHRLPLALAAVRQGHRVTLVAGEERGEGGAIREQGIDFISLPIRRGAASAVHDLVTLAALIGIYLRERPDLVHHVGLKPVVYGSIAARITGPAAIVNAIAGRGYLQAAAGRKAKLASVALDGLLRIAFGGRSQVAIFQNPEDQAAFIERGFVSQEDSVLIRGAGVDLLCFAPAPEPEGPPMILFASRLLRSKGLEDLVEACQLLRAEGLSPRLVVVGVPDERSPDRIPETTLREWVDRGAIERWGLRYDMAEVMRSAAIVCLPTFYGEGIPKVLIEAAASGRAIVATDQPGCREIVRHGFNGLLVPPRDVSAIAAAIRALLLDSATRRSMGANGRELAESEFGVDQVVEQTLRVYGRLIHSDHRCSRGAPSGHRGAQ